LSSPNPTGRTAEVCARQRRARSASTPCTVFPHPTPNLRPDPNPKLNPNPYNPLTQA